MAANKKIDVHKFITTVFNPNLNEFMLPVSDTGMGPSIHEGRIIYGKNKLHLSADGFSLFQIKNELFHLGASQSSDFSVDYDTFLLSLEPLYKFYLKNRGNHLSKQIEAVFESADLMLETDYFAIKLSKNEIYQEEFSLRSRNVNPVKVKKSDQGYNIYQGKKLLGIESHQKQPEQKKFSEGINEKIVLEEGYEFDSSSGFVKKKEESNEINLNSPQKWEEGYLKEKTRGQIKGSTVKKIFIAIFLIIIGITVVSVIRLSSNQIIKVDKIQVNSSQAMSGDSIFCLISFTKDIDTQGDPLTSFLNDIKPLHSFIMNNFSITKIIDVNLDEVLLIRKDITIDANKTYNYSFPVSAKDPGRHIISVGNTSCEFVILNQSRFNGDSFNIQPYQPWVSEEIIISVDVTNVGAITDIKNMQLYVNNDKIEESQINLFSGQEKTIKFTISEEIIGNYNITLIGLSDKFTKIISVTNPYGSPLDRISYYYNIAKKYVPNHYLLPDRKNAEGLAYLLNQVKLPEYEANVFDCSDCSAFIEWLLEGAGFHAYIVIRPQLGGVSYVPSHSWVQVETEDGIVAIETTSLTSGAIYAPPGIVMKPDGSFYKLTSLYRQFLEWKQEHPADRYDYDPNISFGEWQAKYLWNLSSFGIPTDAEYYYGGGYESPDILIKGKTIDNTLHYISESEFDWWNSLPPSNNPFSK